ncbi:MAG: hypothetical protein CL489_08950 [Acidobacteria bacterium]|nr:hypothetical protein [Acidobacteriota bacterium]|tara:strand:- start:36911 stop:37426 length:516 start_codon:yes stop_codon:yes gene_type:complete
MNEELKKSLMNEILNLKNKLELFNSLDRPQLRMVGRVYDNRAFFTQQMSPLQATIEFFKFRFSQPRQMGTTTLIKELVGMLGDTTIITLNQRIGKEFYNEKEYINDVNVVSQERFSTPAFRFHRKSPQRLHTIIISDEIDSMSMEYKQLMDNIFSYIQAKGFPILLLDFSR